MIGVNLGLLRHSMSGWLKPATFRNERQGRFRARLASIVKRYTDQYVYRLIVGFFYLYLSNFFNGGQTVLLKGLNQF